MAGVAKMARVARIMGLTGEAASYSRILIGSRL